MRRLLMGLLAAVMLTATAAAADVDNIGLIDRAAIRGVIEHQIAAFRRDDGPAAFAFASPAIRATFRTPETFLAMVREHYPQVYRPSTVAFGDLFRDDGRLIQLVALAGADGRPVAAAYEMERQPDGSWRINGCKLLGPRDRSA